MSMTNNEYRIECQVSTEKIVFTKVYGGYAHVASGITITPCPHGWQIRKDGRLLEAEYRFNEARRRARNWVRTEMSK